MRKLGAGLFVLIMVVVAGYGFYWYQVKSRADDMVQQMAPFAQVSYGSVYAHPDGTVGVNDLTIAPLQMHAPVSIETVRVRADGPLFFLFGGDAPPEQLNISLRQVRQGLDSELFRTIQQQSELLLEDNPLYVSPNALGCGNVRQFDVNAMRRMGFNELVMDLDLQYRGDTRARKVNLNMLVDIQDMAETRMEMAFSADPSQLQNPMMASGSARLETLSFSYKDQGYNQRRDNFCASESNIKPAEYQQQHQALFEQWLSGNNIELPPTLLAAYNELQKPGVDMALSMRPVGGVGAAEVMMQEPMALLQSLNLQFSINDKPLALDTLDWPELMSGLAEAGSSKHASRSAPAASEKMTTATVPEQTAGVIEKTPVSGSKPQQREQPVRKRFRVTPLVELPEYLGAQVRIFTYFGNDVEGVLTHAGATSIRVEQRLQQGLAEFPLDHDRIQQAEVWR